MPVTFQQRLREHFLAVRNVAAFRAYGRCKPSVSGSKVAIFKPDRLGDFILALEAIRILVEKFRAEECVLFISPLVEELARREFPGVALVTLPPFQGKLWSGWNTLRSQLQEGWWKHSFRMVISLRHQRTPWQEMLLARMRSSAKWALENQSDESHPLERRFVAAPLSHAVPRPGDAGASQCLEFEFHRVLLEHVLGTHVESGRIIPRLRPPEGNRPNESVLLCPFGSAEIRTIPASTLAAGLSDRSGLAAMPLRMAAPPGEESRYEKYADALVESGVPRPVVIPTKSLSALISEVASASVIIATESAPAHIAAALDRPLIALIGGGHYGRFAPWGRSSKQAWISLKMDCFHCNWKCIHPKPLCITEIPPREIGERLSILRQPAS